MRSTNSDKAEEVSEISSSSSSCFFSFRFLSFKALFTCSALSLFVLRIVLVGNGLPSFFGGFTRFGFGGNNFICLRFIPLIVVPLSNVTSYVSELISYREIFPFFGLLVSVTLISTPH